MRKLMLAYVLTLAALIAVPVAGIAYAATDSAPSEAAIGTAFQEAASDAITLSGSGIGAAILLSILRVIGKRLEPTIGTDGKAVIEPFNIKKLLVTVLFGAIAGVVLPYTGLPKEALFGLEFVAIYAANQLARPIFKTWTLK